MIPTLKTVVRESRYAVRAYFAPFVWLVHGLRALVRLAFARPTTLSPIVSDTAPASPQQTPTDTHSEAPA